MYSDYRPSGFSLLPNVVKNLLIINGLFFLAKLVLAFNFNINLDKILGLHYPFSSDFKSYQLITYMFMHGNFPHLFFNMFAIWMFGSAIENVWGGKRFLVFYIITGLGAAFIHYIIVHFQIAPDINMMNNFLNSPDKEKLFQFIQAHEFLVHPEVTPEIYPAYEKFKGILTSLESNPHNQEALHESTIFITKYLEHFENMPVVVGASGSLFGLLLAFGMMFPNATIMLLFFPFPIKAKYFVIGYGVMELFSGLRSSPDDNVAHFAHLGGMLFGFLLIQFWKRTKNKGY